MHILIVEDEIPAFEKLRSILSIQLESTFSYDWARSVKEAKQYLENAQAYKLIFSDIKLLDGNVFDIFDNLTIYVPIIFCSAYDAYLFKAFKANGIEYVLKPYTAEDISLALAKYNNLFHNESPHLSSKLIDELKQSLLHQETHYKKQFIIKTSKGIHILENKAIAMIEAQGDFCKIIESNAKVHLYSQNLGSIYLTLDPKKFFRINRSTIVHLPYIQKMENHFKNRLVLTLQGVSKRVMTSSATTADFRAWLER